MNVVLVTSEVTFVPKNYDTFILGMAGNSHIIGLIVVKNKSWDIFLKAIALTISGAAPKLGLTLLKNSIDNSLERKKTEFEKHGKKFWAVEDINSLTTLAILEAEKVDVILNARTRSLFKKNLLKAPRLGCLNIHHGILPDQRGLMCDFWAHLTNAPVGFSIHEMTSKLDDGALLKVVEVPTPKKDYVESLELGAALEVRAAQEVLDEIEQKNAIKGKENRASEATIYRSNPGITDFFKLQLKGVRT